MSRERPTSLHCTSIGAVESISVHASRLGVQERKSDVNAFDVFETMDVRQNQLVDISTMDVRQNQCADLLKVCTVSATVVIPTQELGNWEPAAPPKRERGDVGSCA